MLTDTDNIIESNQTFSSAFNLIIILLKGPDKTFATHGLQN